ncbi:hypothetical protein RhiJN_17282 [Ceratobasidium sp. AG-Ba]|nr:hypothetical protein RhiJN_17282 [Ceratobasidium sp. AG-Ba]
MFAASYALAAFAALSSVGSAVATPTGLAPRADWKDQYGWDGKSISPVELDPSNAVRPTPGKPAAPSLPGGVYFCDNFNFGEPCVSATPAVIRRPGVIEPLDHVSISLPRSTTCPACSGISAFRLALFGMIVYPASDQILAYTAISGPMATAVAMLLAMSSTPGLRTLATMAGTMP